MSVAAHTIQEVSSVICNMSARIRNTDLMQGIGSGRCNSF